MVLALPAMSQGLILKLYNYRPTGEFGFVMKPTYSAELGFESSFDKTTRFKYHFSATFLKMKPRLESFPIYGILHDGSGEHVLPGSQSFQKYNIAQIFGGFDIAFIKKAPFYAYAGLDVTIGAASVEYTDYIETFKDESYSGGGILAGFRVRLGAQYDLSEHWGIMLNAERSVWLLSDPAAINWSNQYGLGVIYKFE
jgi:opacity protein-like surface antigen